MTKILDEVLAANAKYAENFGDKHNLPLPPSRHFAILTCMDARLEPAIYVADTSAITSIPELQDRRSTI